MKKYLLAVVFLCLSFLSYSDGTEVLDQDTNTGVITQAKDFTKAVSIVYTEVTKRKHPVTVLENQVTVAQGKKELVLER